MPRPALRLEGCSSGVAGEAGVLRVWEALLACPASRHAPMYLAAAILVHHRRAILQQARGDGGGGSNLLPASATLTATCNTHCTLLLRSYGAFINVR
jgi:hypothetical protein